MTPGFSSTYDELLEEFPPRPIQSEQGYWAVQAQIDALIDKGDLTPDEQDFLSLLGMLVERYETEHEPMPELRGVALVKALMAESSLRQRDLLPIFKTDSIVSAVLHGHRKLTVEHIEKLAEFFQLPHSLFFEPIVNESEEPTSATLLVMPT